MKAFIDDYFGDNAGSASRADMTLYTILGYMSIFRISELGFPKFKAIAMQQEPSKVAFFCNYVFNEVQYNSAPIQSFCYLISVYLTVL